MKIELGRVGIWSRGLRFNEDRSAAAEAAAELEELGYSTLWIPDVGGDVLAKTGELLDATKKAMIATGILNIWMHDAATVGTGWAELEERHAGRFTLGLGASHAPIVDAVQEGRYRRPYSTMVEYLDALDAASPSVPAERRVLAALGPRMLDLSRDRAGGAHPYLVTPEHTAIARDALGPERVLAPEQSVLLDADATRGRERAHAFVADYLQLPNYVNNLRRLGFSEDDVSGAGSERLVEALVAWGDEATIAERVAAHHAAGADHVCIQVIDAGDTLPLEQWRRLAPALIG
jgi:probable F420-dependent oxidoreductase